MFCDNIVVVKTTADEPVYFFGGFTVMDNPVEGTINYRLNENQPKAIEVM